eukprot:MONOS_1983.1-p1 / transcript=MONOS_1983.1 / gene=MONOS_1983 / organism=Monocercomonoides_exilis_PA203 / gene_product=unspecified product / transcript_product=unspecified product / location=Mono_scaffold00038:66980-68247(-) / protein_length=403 / sequence_SO=supercontig / SO=protein_coding / is_pseudo=false
MNLMFGKMDRDELDAILSLKTFNEIDRMIEEKKLSIENALLLLKHLAHYKMMTYVYVESFPHSSLCYTLEKLIFDEMNKKEEKNVKLLADLCACFFTMNDERAYDEPVPAFASYLLNVVLNKKENEEVQNEEEFAFPTLSNARQVVKGNECRSNEISETVRYQKDHHNLAHLACESSWRVLIEQSMIRIRFEKADFGELKFVDDATRELDELERKMDWKKKEGEVKEINEVLMIMRWCYDIGKYFLVSQLNRNEFSQLIKSAERMYKSARSNHADVLCHLIYVFEEIALRSGPNIDCLLKEGVVDLMLEELNQPELKLILVHSCMTFFSALTRELNKDTANAFVKESEWKSAETKRKTIKKEVHEKLEEEGYEDAIIKIHFLMRPKMDISRFASELQKQFLV